MNVSVATAARYVEALTASPDTEVTWQLFADTTCSHRAAVVYHTTVFKLSRELAFQNARGVGIFMMVNRGDGLDRKAENVVALRALFVDDDRGVLPPGAAQLSPVPPSFSVQTKRGWHHYWSLVAGEPLDAFGTAQSQLAAHFGTDPAVKDLPRVMRVPGFFHMKDPAAPFLVELLAGSGRRHSVRELLAAYPAAIRREALRTRGAPRPAPRQGAHRNPGEAAQVLEAFRGLRLVRWAMEQPEDVSYEAWRGIATNIAAAVVDYPALHDPGLELFEEISAADPSRYRPEQCQKTFSSALKSARDYGPMLYATLAQAGVPTELCAAGAVRAAAPVGVARILAQSTAAKRPTPGSREATALKAGSGSSLLR